MGGVTSLAVNTDKMKRGEFRFTMIWSLETHIRADVGLKLGAGEHTQVGGRGCDSKDVSKTES